MSFPATLRSSGDLLADRRFAYAQDAFKEGDHAAAADLARQALERAPGFAPAQAVLGRALLKLGDAAGARAALTEALRLDPQDSLGVRVELARLGALPTEEAISPGYVRALFDDYAPRFDKHLVKNLNYRGPELLAEAVRRASMARPGGAWFARGLDLGCGTGLAARAFAGMSGAIDGVDLSPSMLKQARKTHLYEELHEAELVDFLRRCGERAYDLVIAADVLVYVAALDEVFAGVARSLRRFGLFAFSVQAHDGSEDYVIGEDARYSHAESYLWRTAERAGLSVALLDRASTRQECGRDVPGFVAVLER